MRIEALVQGNKIHEDILLLTRTLRRVMAELMKNASSTVLEITVENEKRFDFQNAIVTLVEDVIRAKNSIILASRLAICHQGKDNTHLDYDDNKLICFKLIFSLCQ